MLPTPPTRQERTSYVQRKLLPLTLLSVIGFCGVMVSMTKFSFQATWTMLYLIPLAFAATYFFVSLLSNHFGRGFDLRAHHRLVAEWMPEEWPTIDVFLPTCGEDMDVLRNTAEHVAALEYPGRITVLSLDDSNRPEVRELAEEFGFRYLSRPNRGWFKKAGNLRYGFERSDSEFVVVLDADFAPAPDFLRQLLPYFDEQPDLGIVQSPQFFRVADDQHWIERGAGAVQELMYRVVETSRQRFSAAICVGTNAIYRRAALDTNGGSTLIEHSEDVHTGFDLFRNGWRLQYVPLNLATGLCPSTLQAFFSQQYRWCMGSMSLLTSAKFWTTKLSFRARLCYMAGFMYYIETGFMTIVAPLVPLTMILAFPQNVRLVNYVLLVPAAIYSYVVFPRWHRCRYSWETWATKMAYGWAHLFAMVDKLRNQPLAWSPTLGRRATSSTGRQRAYRISVMVWGGGTAAIWVLGSAVHLFGADPVAWIPMTVLGCFYAAVVVRLAAAFSPDGVLRRNLVRREGDPLPPFVPAPAISPAGTPAATPAAGRDELVASS